MRKQALIPAILALSGCSSPSVEIEGLSAKLVLSDGHSQCVSQRVKTQLDAARIVEVIPGTRNCTATEAAMSVLPGSSVTCPQSVTAVHFRRLAEPARTDSILQDGWLGATSPTRIAKTTNGDFAVFVAKGNTVRTMAAAECGLFEERVRAGLALHFQYAATQPGR